MSALPALGTPMPERTKSRLLELVKRHGPLTAQDLAQRLEVSVPAARRHLGDLQEQELIVCRTERPGGRGRPQHVFTLSERGEAAFPKTYSTLCVDVLRHIESLFGEGAVLRVLDARNVELAGRLRDDLAAAGSLGERVQTLAARLDEQGFDTTVEQDGDVWYLTERNCPNLTVARQYPQLCESELGLYLQVLDVPVQRDRRIACGQAACRYRIG
ncbi:MULTISPECIES: helix-turn-helix transcriptional regulator [Deinococcus]|uniref:Metalloregulator ArsR/SmtB family transcription factor n=1 Tax=Deinococcus rufus TaxID=2136097 RepID=A0ABV7ZA76_9DEIO|nr:metalloregulator ArsR/SmtB family transcription factor [Deinococcus sp. AB2017081]WQE94545.1 metalloregulator ArsR/SmtB family transcription factor [Deinococcus sp. AB2017081]